METYSMYRFDQSSPLRQYNNSDAELLMNWTTTNDVSLQAMRNAFVTSQLPDRSCLCCIHLCTLICPLFAHKLDLILRCNIQINLNSYR